MTSSKEGEQKKLNYLRASRIRVSLTMGQGIVSLGSSEDDALREEVL